MANRNPSPATRFRTGKEQETIARNGGKKSGEVRRSIANFRECFQGEITDEMRIALCNMLYQRALHGNLRAFEILRDTMGERPTESVTVYQTDPEVIKAIEEFLESDQETD